MFTVCVILLLSDSTVRLLIANFTSCVDIVVSWFCILYQTNITIQLYQFCELNLRSKRYDLKKKRYDTIRL